MLRAVGHNSRFEVSGEILRDKVVVKGKTEIDGVGHPTPDMDKVQTVGVGAHQYCIGSDVKRARGELSLVFNWAIAWKMWSIWQICVCMPINPTTQAYVDDSLA